MNKTKRPFLTNALLALMMVSTAVLGIGCGSDTPTSSASTSDTSASAPSVRMFPSSRVVLPSLKAETPFRGPIAPRFNKFDRVHAMSNGTLRIIIDVNNDTTGYAWPSANQVGHVLVNGAPWFVDTPDVYASNALVDIPLSPGSYTVMLVEDYWTMMDLEYNTVGNTTISSGQTVTQYAFFNDKDCAPSCP